MLTSLSGCEARPRLCPQLQTAMFLRAQALRAVRHAVPPSLPPRSPLPLPSSSFVFLAKNCSIFQHVCKFLYVEQHRSLAGAGDVGGGVADLDRLRRDAKVLAVAGRERLLGSGGVCLHRVRGRRVDDHRDGALHDLGDLGSRRSGTLSCHVSKCSHNVDNLLLVFGLVYLFEREQYTGHPWDTELHVWHGWRVGRSVVSSPPERTSGVLVHV